MTDTLKSSEDQEIARFIAKRGVKRLPARTPRGIGPSRWAPNVIAAPNAAPRSSTEARSRRQAGR